MKTILRLISGKLRKTSKNRNPQSLFINLLKKRTSCLRQRFDTSAILILHSCTQLLQALDLLFDLYTSIRLKLPRPWKWQRRKRVWYTNSLTTCRHSSPESLSGTSSTSFCSSCRYFLHSSFQQNENNGKLNLHFTLNLFLIFKIRSPTFLKFNKKKYFWKWNRDYSCFFWLLGYLLILHQEILEWKKPMCKLT